MSSSQFPNLIPCLDFATCVCLSDIWYKFIFLCICALAWNVLLYCQNARFRSCWLAGRLATSSAAQLPPLPPIHWLSSHHCTMTSPPFLWFPSQMFWDVQVYWKPKWATSFHPRSHHCSLHWLLHPASRSELSLSFRFPLLGFSTLSVVPISQLSQPCEVHCTPKTSCQHKSLHFSSFQSVPWWRGATTNCCHLNVLLYRAWWRSERQFCWIESKFSPCALPRSHSQHHQCHVPVPNTLPSYHRHPSWRWLDEAILSKHFQMFSPRLNWLWQCSSKFITFFTFWCGFRGLITRLMIND